MIARKIGLAVIATVLAAAGLASATSVPARHGYTFKVLHYFDCDPSCLTGADLQSGLTLDSHGNLYGVAFQGGGNFNCAGEEQGCGTIFRLSPASHGEWEFTTLIEFDGTDGGYPLTSPIFDASGNLYGTTYVGGEYDYGTVYELSPGTSNLNTIATFSGANGIAPLGNIVFDSAGNLYGVTQDGGTLKCDGGDGCGTVYQLSPQGDGTWMQTTLASFPGGKGAFPYAGPVLGADGNLYGSTQQGRLTQYGSIYELSPGPDESWMLTTIFRFNGGNGANPEYSLVFDQAGNLYGTATEGGDLNCTTDGCGTVFRLSPNGDGTWKETTLHVFSVGEGNFPSSSLSMDAAGNLYGTTYAGGDYANCFNGCGTIYRLSPQSNGNWKYTDLFDFDGPHGASPEGGLTVDPAGNVFGVTNLGPTLTGGTVFELSPTTDSRER
jgi:uncharacterized repeat protein (TIGR03803 family)